MKRFANPPGATQARILVALLLAALTALASSAQDDVQPPLVLANATLIDGTGAAPRPGATIVVEKGQITRIVEGAVEEPPPGARVVDLEGRFILPGLIDAHVHLAPLPDHEATLTGLLEAGVTTVRDMGGDTRTLAVLARDAKLGVIRSPDIYFSAVVFGPSWLEDSRARDTARGLEPGTAPWSRAVTSESDLRQVVAEARGTGATGLKLYAGIEPGLVRDLAAEAHRQGLEVWSHTTIYPSKPSDAVAAGVDVVSHSVGLFPESRSDLPPTYREGIYEWLPQQDFTAVDPAAPPYEALFDRMQREGSMLEPTIAMWMAQRPAPRSAPPSGERAEARPRIDRAVYAEWACAATRAAHQAGVALVAGTDLTHRRQLPLGAEIEALVECGLEPLEAIQAATLHGARAIGKEDTLGSVEVGKAADLVILSADPVEDIQNVRSVAAVVKSGRLIEPEKRAGTREPTAVQ